MTKSLPERLRKVARDLTLDPRKPECRIADALYPDLCSEFDCGPCNNCLGVVFESVLGEIECEYVKTPVFGSDGARDLFLETMEEMADTRIVKVVRVNADDGSAESLKLVFEPPKDTLEAIEKDARLYFGDYCKTHEGVLSNHDMIIDLLRRQREVLERDAEKPEERTCRNVAAYFGDFECSECGCKATWETKYCPECGAKVVGKR